MNSKKNKDIKKIGIIGMGPVGMILAVKLKEAGWDVSICVRNKIKLNSIKTRGIKLEGVYNSSTHFDKLYGSVDEMTDQDFDYLVFALKSYQISYAAQQAKKINSKKLTVVSAQNGIDVEELLIPEFGAPKVVRMIVNYAGNLSALNVVNVTFFNPPNYIGSIDDNKLEEANILADALNRSKYDNQLCRLIRNSEEKLGKNHTQLITKCLVWGWSINNV